MSGADGAGDAPAEGDAVGEALGCAFVARCVVLGLGVGLAGVVDGEALGCAFLAWAVVCLVTGELALVGAGLTHR